MGSLTGEVPALLYPLGHLVGVHDGFEVRLGSRLHRLDPAGSAVWALAHGSPTPTTTPWTAAAVTAAAAAAGVEDPAGALAGLRGTGLVREAAPETPSVRDLARSVRLFPLLLGLGNSAEEPEVWSAGLLGQPLVAMSESVYDLFQWAHLDSDLLTAVERAARAAARSGLTSPDATDPARLLDLLFGTLHALLTPGAVYLDTWQVA